MPYRGLIGELVEISRIGTEELSLEWRIWHFSSLCCGRNDCYAGPDFKIDDVCWCLVLWPNWKDESRNPASGWVKLALYRSYRGSPKPFHVSVGIRGFGGVEKSREDESEFCSHDKYSWNDFCSRSDLMEPQTRLMPDGILTITCVLKRPIAATGVMPHPQTTSQTSSFNRSQSSDKQDASTQTDGNLEFENLNEVNQSSEKRGCEKVHEDFAKLLDSGEDSDVTVQVGGVEFKVHKAILSVRSPVLSAMFRYDTLERASKRISVCDCEPEVFREYLQYIYSGSVGLLSDGNAFSLYRIADKYLADDLKQQCLEHIRKTLSVQTFCDTVELALTHGESDLLQLAIGFATRNIPTIIRSVEWQRFIGEFPTEANEILIKCIRPCS